MPCSPPGFARVRSLCPYRCAHRRSPARRLLRKQLNTPDRSPRAAPRGRRGAPRRPGAPTPRGGRGAFDAASLEAREALLDVHGPPGGPGPVRRAGRIAETTSRAPQGSGSRAHARQRGRVNYLSRNAAYDSPPRRRMSMSAFRAREFSWSAVFLPPSAYISYEETNPARSWPSWSRSAGLRLKE